MIVVKPIKGTRFLQDMRASITQRVIDCTLTPDDALLHLSFSILDRHIANAEQEIQALIQQNTENKKVRNVH